MFNAYGNLPLDGPIEELMQTIEDTTKDILDDAMAQDASIVDLRALEACITGRVSVTCAEFRLRQCLAKKKAKRDR